MNKQSAIEKIYNDNLCLGCGLCEGVCGKDSVEMQLQKNGFYKPVTKGVINSKDEEIINKICPGINVVNDLQFREGENIWGKIEGIYSGYTNDKDAHKKGSSGGIVSGLAIFLLESTIVDAVLQVGGDSDDYERNSLKISKNKQDVLDCASSRYAPALIFSKIFEILNQTDHKFCFIGKPCDISALKNFLSIYPQYKDRFKLTISIICAGMPSFKGTEAIIKEFKAAEPVKDLVYRGNGWPGFFSFKDKDEKEYQMTYNESWGKRLGKHVHLRCKICPDGIGLQADIAVGDAWETNDGYPDFTEKEGRSLIISRTENGSNILRDALDSSSINYESIGLEKLAIMQPFQYGRRHKVGIRALAFSLAKRRKLNYQHLSLFKNTTKLSPKVVAREFFGMFKRALKNNMR